MNRIVVALIILAASLFAFGSTALAESPLQGGPSLTPERPVGYYIWHDEDGMHLRTHGPGAEHHFTARLHSDGIFEDVEAVRLENADNFAVVGAGHTLLIDFHTYNWTDGVNFRLKDAGMIRFALKLDGEVISTDSIFLGAEGVHPESNPFIIRR